MNETACRIIVNAIVENARYHENFFRTGSVYVESGKGCARVNLNNLRIGAVLALPENSLADSGKDFLCRVSPESRFAHPVFATHTLLLPIN
jgi:hypothetical protein